VETDRLLLSVTENGRLGYADLNSTIGEGFRINEDDILLSNCDIISGVSSLQIYSSVRQVTDFKTISKPEKIPNDFFDFHVKYEFNDSSDISPLGIRYIQDIYSKYGDNYKYFIFADYTLINESDEDFENYYFGLFADWELINGNINSSGYVEDEEFLFCKSDNTETLYAGIKLLSSQPVKNYAIPLISGGDGLVDFTNGLSDIERFHIISNSNNGYEFDSIDISQYTGAGPINFASGDTVIISFALIASYDYYNFMNGLSESKKIYKELHDDNNSFIMSQKNDLIEIFPNPARKFLTFNISPDCENAYYEIVNTAGICVLKSGLTSNTISINSLPAGIYELKITCNDKAFTKKFIKID
jgi:hypothetical protein